MASTYCNDARSKVASAGGRSIGGTTLTVVDGSKYQGTAGAAPSPSAPAKLTIIRWSGSDYSVVTVLKCTGRSGNVLTIDGATDGYADAAVLADDGAMCGPTAGDLEGLQAADAANAAAVAGKQDALPSQAGNAGKVLQTDGTALSWQTPSGGGSPGGSTGQIQYNASGSFAGSASLVFDATNKRLGISATPASTLDVQANGSEDLLTLRNSSGAALLKVLPGGFALVDRLTFSLAQGVDLAAGTNVTRSGGIAAFAGVVAKVLVQASTNGSGGGFTLQVNKNGSSIFSTNPTVAASTTSVQGFTPTTTSAAANDVFTIDVSSPGTGVQNVIVVIVMLARNQ